MVTIPRGQHGLNVIAHVEMVPRLDRGHVIVHQHWVVAKHVFNKVWDLLRKQPLVSKLLVLKVRKYLIYTLRELTLAVFGGLVEFSFQLRLGMWPIRQNKLLPK